MESKIRHSLSMELVKLKEEIKEGLNYGVPHIVGEITNDSSPKISVSVAVFENSRHSWVLRDNGSVLFMHPAEDASPHRLFFEIWRLLDGKKRENNGFGPGSRIRGILKASLQREGFEILWMNVRTVGSVEYVDVWARKGENRYNMLFQKLSSGDYVLMEMEKV